MLKTSVGFPLRQTWPHQDALWIARNGKCLQDFAGIDQHGGVGDPLMMVRAFVLHIQLRYFQGLQTWLALADLKWAFDVADIPSMLVYAFKAGVCGEDWLLLDDILSLDCQRISLMGLMSPTFVLGCGTAQGRRFSVQVFNSLLRWLKEEVEKVQPCGCDSWLPPFAAKLMHVAEKTIPPLALALPPLELLYT